MYLWTRDELAQIPTLYGPLAGTLGEPPLPPEIQRFLDRVKGSPHDYEALLLTSTFHVEPWSSDHLHRLIGSTYSGSVTTIEEAKAIQERVIEALQNIHQQHLTENDFSKLVSKETQLISVVAKAFQKRIKEIETRNIKWFEEILTEALLLDIPPLTQQVGKNFVLFHLPSEIAESVLNSRVPETHYARLGKAFLLMAEQRQKDKPAFKRRVEQERKKRGK
jgi:hypothetical protein